LNEIEEEKLLRVSKEHKSAIGWSIGDLEGISPFICMHKILMEDDFEPAVQPQRKLNPSMKEVAKKEGNKIVRCWCYLIYSRKSMGESGASRAKER
jgi:hypothetical protein